MTTLKLYVWRDFGAVTHPGLAVAVAVSAAQARALVLEELAQSNWPWSADFMEDLSAEPEAIAIPAAAWVSGGR